jgi:hypothetical protein
MAAPALSSLWQRLPTSQQLLVRVGGSALVLWGLTVLTLRPLQQRLRVLKQEVGAAEARLLAAVAANEQAERVHKAFTQYRAYVKRPESAEVELAGFMTEVEQAAKEAGIAEPYLKPLKGPETAANVLSATIEAESSPAQLMAFLDKIQRSARLLRVKELTARVTEARSLRSSLVLDKLLLQVPDPSGAK